MWIQGGRQHQTTTKMLSDALRIGLDPNYAAITKHERSPSGGSIDVSTLWSMADLYTLSCKLPWEPANAPYENLFHPLRTGLRWARILLPRNLLHGHHS